MKLGACKICKTPKPPPPIHIDNDRWPKNRDAVARLKNRGCVICRGPPFSLLKKRYEQVKLFWYSQNYKMIVKMSRALGQSPDDVFNFLYNLTMSRFCQAINSQDKSSKTCRVPLTEAGYCDLYLGIFDANGNLLDPLQPKSLLKLLELMQEAFAESPSESNNSRDEHKGLFEVIGGGPKGNRSGCFGSCDPLGLCKRDTKNFYSIDGKYNIDSILAGTGLVDGIASIAGLGEKELGFDQRGSLFKDFDLNRGSRLRGEGREGGPGDHGGDRREGEGGFRAGDGRGGEGGGRGADGKGRDGDGKGGDGKVGDGRGGEGKDGKGKGGDGRGGDGKGVDGKGSGADGGKGKGGKGGQAYDSKDGKDAGGKDGKGLTDKERSKRQQDGAKKDGEMGKDGKGRRDPNAIMKAMNAADMDDRLDKRKGSQFGDISDLYSKVAGGHEAKGGVPKPMSEADVKTKKDKSAKGKKKKKFASTNQKVIGEQIPVLVHEPFDELRPATWIRRHPDQMRITAKGEIGKGQIRRYRRETVEKHLAMARKKTSVLSTYNMEMSPSMQNFTLFGEPPSKKKSVVTRKGAKN